ncbi:hypothetical protein MMC29_001473 [Sticta canariensis]|nr:hypothetical protein [Sticta canariensis]
MALHGHSLERSQAATIALARDQSSATSDGSVHQLGRMQAICGRSELRRESSRHLSLRAQSQSQQYYGVGGIINRAPNFMAPIITTANITTGRDTACAPAGFTSEILCASGSPEGLVKLQQQQLQQPQ